MTLTDRPTEAEAEQLFGLQQAVHAADTPDNPTPLWDALLAETSHTSAEWRRRWLIARVDEEVVATARITLPEIDNREAAEINILVAPRHRRRGIGTALMERCYQLVADEKRGTVITGAIRPRPGGPARPDAGAQFLERLGFSPGLELIQRRLDLTTIDEDAEQRLVERCWPHAGDYQLHSWTGATPDEFAAGVAYLVNRLMIDAPAGELSLNQTTMDADRLRADERHTLLANHLVTAVAQHRETGAAAAISQLKVRSVGDHASVSLTLADPAHRGHRLGTLAKIAVHRLARQTFPTLRYVHTGNADTNAHMAAINEQLGFVAYQTGVLYQQHRR